MPDLIIQPFANTGTKSTPPQTDPTGFVNFTDGYTSDYEINLAAGNPQAKAVERAVQNYMFNLLTANAQSWQQNGTPPWFAAMPGGYAQNAMVLRQSGATWLPYRSLVPGNVTDPLGSTSWEYIQGSGEMIKNIPMPAGGTGGPSTALITAATGFNTFTVAGTYEFQTDAVAGASAQAPSSVGGTAAGLLEVMTIPSTSGNTYTIQRYLDRNGVIYTRSATNGSWTAWNVMPNFTQIQAGRYAGFATYAASQVIVASQGGYAIQSTGATVTFTLPSQALLVPGVQIMFVNNGTGLLTLLASGTDNIRTTQNSTATSVVLQVGDSLQLTSSATAGVYAVTNGTAALQFVNGPKIYGTANFNSARPIFNGNTPWDNGNLPLPFQTTGGTVSGQTNFSGGLNFAGVPAAGYAGIQGGYASWNEGGMPFSGATSLVNNQGGGTGGFIFRNINVGNTAETGRVTFSATGTINATGGANFGARPTWAGYTAWDNGNLPNPAQTTGATMTGPLYVQGVSTNGFENGTGDAASYATYNFAIRGWNGMGMRSFDNSINGYYDFRAGKWDTKGGFYVNGVRTWDATNFNPANYLPLAGGTMSGLLGLNAGLWVGGSSSIALSSPSYTGYLRGDSSGQVGFINQAQNQWNLQITDVGNVSVRGSFTSIGDIRSSGWVYAGNGTGYLTNSGDVSGATWGGALSTWISGQLAGKVPVRNTGYGGSGYVINNSGNIVQMSWGANVDLSVDTTYIGAVITHLNFQNFNIATKGARVQWDSGTTEVGPFGNGTIGDTAPYVVVGGRACGNSATANCMWLELALLRNQ